MIAKMFRAVLFVAVALFAASSGCGGKPSSPSSSPVATIAVGGETFRLLLDTQELVDQARAAMAGGQARIPSGRIVMGTQVNTGYSWHLENVSFAEVTIELCDGTPSMVEQQGTAFGGGYFCPWSARVVNIR